MEKEVEERLGELQDTLGITFNELSLLKKSLTHDSYIYESEEDAKSNERLEFLGDAVLGLVISHALFSSYPDWTEGDLTLRKSYLVSAEHLTRRAEEINLGDYIFLGKGECSSGGRTRSRILADTTEALIGALYIDGGLDAAKDFILRLFGNSLEEEGSIRDYKSILQEYTQKRYKILPCYRLLSEEGPPHRKTFYMTVIIRGEEMGVGTGSSKKEAEQGAAYAALRRLDMVEEKSVDECPEN